MINYELVEDILTAKDFLKLRETTGWSSSLTEQQVEAGLRNSLVTVSAVCEGRIIGMGRLIGDGLCACYVQDMVVYPEFQGVGIGKSIMDRLISFVKENGYTDTSVTIGLFSAKGKEGFYRNLGFFERPNENQGTGMQLIVKA